STIAPLRTLTRTRESCSALGQTSSAHGRFAFMKGMLIGITGGVIAIGASYAGCSARESKYESVCQLVSQTVVDKSEDGTPELVDLVLEWDPCPGDQFQVIRGGKEFAACVQKYEVGSYLPVHVKQWWDERGYYRWDIYQIGDCTRSIDPDAEGSYEKSQECK